MDATADLRKPARVLRGDAVPTIGQWLQRGWGDLKSNLGVSLAYGGFLAVIGWAVLYVLTATGQGWMILPALAGAMLLGPVATVGLYRISRRRMGLGGGGVAAPGQIFLVSVVLMVLALTWIRAATLLFAVFFGLRPFAGFAETLQTLFATPEGIALFVVGSCVGGLFAALGFAIAAFSLPMLVHRDIDGFSAMGLSFSATTRNFRLALLWGATVTVMIGLSVLSGLILLIPLFPLLGYATWHAYADLFEG
ncbi:putative integral membrane protein [Tritonibacter multivorans]|uniref:Putative integral membrane protein n=1 Tax=Tritonibacter multivorans TaxID=928856 RepID=A0A0P1GAK3_9RHOB|nr:DUF2189 domain-containing protein [Tritonibacter multivorans]MDA7422105.1 DUF2189 domain-containing protein [Tritonibacter multivorans]CUH78459.1 putative integral membrane protein [Tritonibacter multivorans]SFD17207.1 Uncharacterized membrane protein [Tritonibacter multivorans]